MEAVRASCSTSVSSTSSLPRSPSSSSSRAGIPSPSFLWRGSRNLQTPSLSSSHIGKSRSSANTENLASTVLVRCDAASGTVSTVRPTEWVQKQFELPGFSRGCHIITRGIVSAVPVIKEFEVGIAHIFVMHTSCSLTINENASSDVPLDMEDALNRLVPEGHQYRHLDEGLDDMPAHVKASMMGSSLTIPIRAGRLNLGTWQGIWLNEHRNYGGPRTICITIQGQKRADGRVYK